jgi:2-desacetyl-2-hydroxyethyl bacteriochlorophyllide A dehydrogenase
MPDMNALIFDGSLTFGRIERPEPGKDEALIRVLVAGICQTDVEITKGYMKFYGVLGHEFVGEVVKSRDEEWLGKRVVGEINIGCGTCDTCRKGQDRHCPNRSILGIQNQNGVFAEYVTLPVGNLLAVPDAVFDEAAVFVEPLAAACAILEQVPVLPTDRVAVVGDGRLGQLVARILRLTGCELTVIGRHREKLRLLDGIGLRTVEAGSHVEAEFDVVVDASGSKEGWQLAVDMVRPGGTVVLKSTMHAPVVFDTSRIVVDEIRIVGSRCGRFAPALRLLEAGLVDVDRLVSHVFSADNALLAFEAAQEPETLKVLLDFRKP